MRAVCERDGKGLVGLWMGDHRVPARLSDRLPSDHCPLDLPQKLVLGAVWLPDPSLLEHAHEDSLL